MKRPGPYQLPFVRMVAICVWRTAFTTLLLVPFAGLLAFRLGEITVIADPKQCAKGATAQVWAISAAPIGEPLGVVQHVTVGGSISKYMTLVRKGDANVACRWKFDGLAPGAYVVALETPTGSGGSAQVNLVSDDPIDVTVPGPPVVVQGRLLFNDKTVPGARVHIESVAVTSPFIDQVTDRAGRYEATLASPGDYIITSAAGSWRGTLEAGEHALDIAGRGGTLTVDLTEPSPGKAITIVLANPTTTLQRSVRPDEQPLRWFRVPDGTYRVFAHDLAGDLVSSAPATVTISPQDADAHAVLALLENHGSLLVTDNFGRNILGVTVTARIGTHVLPRLREVSRGAFSLRGVPPGADVVIRATGHGASCKSAALDEITTAVLRPGQLTELVFNERVRDRLAEITVSGLVGADCPVPIGSFQGSKFSTIDSSTRLVITDFPSERPLTFRLYDTVLSTTEARGTISVK